MSILKELQEIKKLIEKIEESAKDEKLEKSDATNDIDLSILNERDWFWVHVKDEYSSSRAILRGDVEGALRGTAECEIFFCEVWEYEEKDRWPEDLFKNGRVKELRKPTEEELQLMFERYPTLMPPKIGDWGLFWNHQGKDDYKIGELTFIEERCGDDAGWFEMNHDEHFMCFEKPAPYMTWAKILERLK